jgi:L-ascorbate metabolism protein UlaG (beta-lactamase superfamily)
MNAEITAIGNEGFKIVTGDTIIYVDSFYTPALWVGAAPYVMARDVKKADLILITHRHPDHFDEAGVVDVVSRTGAKVVGPAGVIGRLRNRLCDRTGDLEGGAVKGRARAQHAPLATNGGSGGPALPKSSAQMCGTLQSDDLIELEPVLMKTGSAASASVDLPMARITAFRTFHSPDHNSYLVEMPGFRFFHDGDNEDTSRIDVAELGRIDALFIATWQGAHWVEFIEAVKPGRWFLMHLTDEELDQQKAGTFLPDLCDHVPAPEKLVTLRPGESFTMS